MTISEYADNLAKSGKAFVGQGLSPTPNGIGNVAIWNAYGTGKVLYLDRLIIATTGPTGADLRSIRSLSGFSPFPDHWRNKAGDTGAAPKAGIYTLVGTPPNDYPYNRPHHEFWLPGALNDRAYPLEPPIIIQQGRGEVVPISGNGTCIVTFHWREEDDPLGVVTDPGAPPPLPGALAGTAIGDLANLAYILDGNDATYANSTTDPASVIVGLDLGAGNSSTVSRVIIKSPAGRSFCGADPGRPLTVTYSNDNVTYGALPGGSTTDPGSSSQKVIDLAVALPAAQKHYFKISNPSAAGWRVAGLSLLA